MNLYIVTFENGESMTDVAWFTSTEAEKEAKAEETIREWECMEDEDEVTIGQIYQVSQNMIDECATVTQK